MPRTLSFILLMAATAIVLAACGSSSPSDPTSAQRSAADSARALAFARCMRTHGVSNFPDPTGGRFGLEVQATPNSTRVNGVEVNGPAFRSAMQACHSYLPNGGHPSAAKTAKVKAQALAMARCMRAHGVPDFPDPQFRSMPGGGFGIRLNGAGLNPNSPTFQAAQKACGSIFGGPPMTAKMPDG
jgi:hypothetical protein